MSTVAGQTDARAGRAGPLMIGWVVLLACAVLAVALFFAGAIVWRLACGQGPAYERGPYCAGSLNDIVTVILPAAILVLVIAGALTGVICGLVVIASSAAGIRRVGGIWLGASAALYAGTMVIRAANPATSDTSRLSEIPYIAIRGAEVLFIWLLVTAAVLLVARAMRRVRSAH